MPVPVVAALATIGEVAFWVGLMQLLKKFGVWVIKQAPGWIAHIMAAVGLYFFVAEPLADYGVSWASQQFDGVTGTVLETLYYLNVDNYISATFSAYAIRKASEISLRRKTPKPA